MTTLAMTTPTGTGVPHQAHQRDCISRWWPGRGQAGKCGRFDTADGVDAIVLSNQCLTPHSVEWLTAMKLFFFDEIEFQQKAPGFFGVGLFIINSSFYRGIKTQYTKTLQSAGWSATQEFKGRYLFSQAGDASVSVEQRIALVREIVSGTTARKNARAQFFFAYNLNGRSEANYLSLIEALIVKSPRAPNAKGDKNVALVIYDQTQLVTPGKVSAVSEPALAKRGCMQLEVPSPLPSGNDTPGLIYADTLAYLKSRDVLHPKPVEADQAALFDLSTGQFTEEKVKATREILLGIKHVKVIGPESHARAHPLYRTRARYRSQAHADGLRDSVDPQI